MIARGGYAAVYETKDEGIVAKEYNRRREVHGASPPFLPDELGIPGFLREVSYLSVFKECGLPEERRPFPVLHGCSGRVVLIERGLCFADTEGISTLVNGLDVDAEKIGSFLEEVSDSSWMALSMIHSMGIIHGDVKGSNLIMAMRKDEERGIRRVCRPVKVLLIDWNTARPLSHVGATMPSSIHCTPPDLLADPHLECDARAVETWCMGLTLLDFLSTVHEIRSGRMKGDPMRSALIKAVLAAGGDRGERRRALLDLLHGEGLAGEEVPTSPGSHWFMRRYGCVPREYSRYLSRVDLALSKDTRSRLHPFEMIDPSVRDFVSGDAEDVQGRVSRLFGAWPPCTAISNCILSSFSRRFPGLAPACWMAERLASTFRVSPVSHAGICAVLAACLSVWMGKIVSGDFVARHFLNTPGDGEGFRTFRDISISKFKKLSRRRNFFVVLGVLHHVCGLLFGRSLHRRVSQGI